MRITTRGWSSRIRFHEGNLCTAGQGKHLAIAQARSQGNGMSKIFESYVTSQEGNIVKTQPVIARIGRGCCIDKTKVPIGVEPFTIIIVQYIGSSHGNDVGIQVEGCQSVGYQLCYHSPLSVSSHYQIALVQSTICLGTIVHACDKFTLQFQPISVFFLNEKETIKCQHSIFQQQKRTSTMKD